MNSELVLAILTRVTAVSQVAQVSPSAGRVCRSLPHPRHPPGLSAGPQCPGAREVGALFQPVLEPQPSLQPRGDSPAGCVSARPGTWPGSRASPAGSARRRPWGFHNQPPYCPGTLASPPPLLSRPDEYKVLPGPPNCWEAVGLACMASPSREPRGAALSAHIQSGTILISDEILTQLSLHLSWSLSFLVIELSFCLWKAQKMPLYLWISKRNMFKAYSAVNLSGLLKRACYLIHSTPWKR